MKKIFLTIIMLISVTVLFFALGTTAAAESYGNLTYSVSGGKVTITGCSASATVIEIPSTIDGYPVTNIGYNAFYNCTNLKSVTIPEGVTYIGDEAFYNCTSLTSITIPDSVTSIGYGAFSGCKSLSNVTIPDSVTTILDYAFENCTSLKSITIPEGVTSIGGEAFCYCSSLTSITIPDSVTSIDSDAFHGCSSLKGAFYTGTQEQWDNITSGSSNSGLTSAVYYNVDEDYLLRDNVLFNKNSTMLVVYAADDKYYVVPDTVKSIEQNAFRNSDTLHTVILPQGLKNIGSYAFYSADNLTCIYIPATVSTIDTYAFYNCSNLKDVYFGGTQEQWNAITIGNNNSNLKNANIHFNSELVIEDGVVYNPDKTVLICYDKNEKSFTVPNTVKTIGAIAFKECKNLQQIVLPPGLEEIKSEAFYNCTALSEIVIPESVTTIETSAFYGCTALQSVEFGDGLTTIGNSAFYGCTAIEKFTLPENLVSIGDSAFYGCTNLNDIYFPDSLESIGSSAFANCSALTYISLPDGLISLGSAVFRNCSSLEKICLPESGLASIPANAFNGCSKLSDIYIPVNITSFGDSAFLGCNLLTDIYYDGTEDKWDNISIVSSNSVIWAADVHFNHTHIFGEWTVLIPSQNNSYRVEKTLCLVCGYEKRVSIDGNHVHNYTKVAEIPATCTTAGHASYVCDCELDYTKVLAATGHTFTNTTVDKQHLVSIATCCSKAEYYYKCENCDIFSDIDTFEYGEIDSSNHTGGTQVRNAVTEDCGNNGYTGDTYCLGCNTKIAVGSIIPATGHTYTIAITAPTCTEKGYTTYSCDCGLSFRDNYINPTGHTYSKEVIAPTCTEKGYTIYSCACGFNDKLDYVNATGHTYSKEVVAPTCTEKGYTIYSCACGFNDKLDYVNATGHTAGNWVVVKKAEIGKEGKEQQKCTVCGAVVNERDIPALPEQTTKPIEKPTNKVGDANGDGKITAADARITLRISAKLEKIEDYNLPLSALDVTGDGKLTAADARKILRASAKLETL